MGRSLRASATSTSREGQPLRSGFGFPLEKRSSNNASSDRPSNLSRVARLAEPSGTTLILSLINCLIVLMQRAYVSSTSFAVRRRRHKRRIERSRDLLGIVSSRPRSGCSFPRRSDKCQSAGARRAGPGRASGERSERSLDAPEHARKLSMRSDPGVSDSSATITFDPVPPPLWAPAG